MKLITRTGLYFVAITAFVSLVGGTAFFLYISGLWNEEIDEQLLIEREKITHFAQLHDTIPVTSPLTDHVLQIKAGASDAIAGAQDTILLSPLGDEMLPYRYLRFNVQAGGNPYTVLLLKPLVEKDDLLQAIGKSLIILFLLFLLLTFILQYWMTRKVWKPFYETLHVLEKLDLSHPLNITWPATKTTEFSELQTECTRMLHRLEEQFRHQKEFTDYASHEIQTSLAIMRSKLELVIQDKDLNEQEWKWLQDTFDATDRLSRLTQSLLLLSRLDNHQFPTGQQLEFRAIIESKMEQLAVWAVHRNITVASSLDDPGKVVMDPSLADILIQNVMTNAYKHNYENGNIRITLSPGMLEISNTGLPLQAPAATMFHPFVKSASGTDSPGLGLTIVKRICQCYKFEVQFTHHEGWHTLIIHFP